MAHRRTASGTMVTAALIAAAIPSTSQAWKKPKRNTPGRVAWDIADAFGLLYSSAPIPPFYGNLRSIAMRPHGLSERGSCHVPRRLLSGVDIDYFARRIDDKRDVQVQVLCRKKRGKHVTKRIKRGDWPYTFQTAPLDYSSDLRKIGNRAARAAGIDDADHGVARYARSNKRSAVIKYARPEVDGDSAYTAPRQLRELRYQGRKSPVAIWY